MSPERMARLLTELEAERDALRARIGPLEQELASVRKVNERLRRIVALRREIAEDEARESKSSRTAAIDVDP